MPCILYFMCLTCLFIEKKSVENWWNKIVKCACYCCMNRIMHAERTQNEWVFNLNSLCYFCIVLILSQLSSFSSFSLSHIRTHTLSLIHTSHSFSWKICGNFVQHQFASKNGLWYIYVCWLTSWKLLYILTNLIPLNEAILVSVRLVFVFIKFETKEHQVLSKIVK